MDIGSNQDILVCGQSYSENFVFETDPMAGFMMQMSGDTDSVAWSRQYTSSLNANAGEFEYISSFEVCKFTEDQSSIMASGTVNFYKSFIGLFSTTDGSIEKILRIYSSEDYFQNMPVGPSTELFMDSRGDIYGSLSFLNSGLDLFKVDMDGEKLTW